MSTSERGNGAGERGESGAIEQHETHRDDVGDRLGEDRADRDRSRLVERIAVDPRGNGRECQAARAEPIGDPQRLAIARGQLRRAVVADRVDGPDGVDDPPCGQAPGGGGDRLADGKPVWISIGAQPLPGAVRLDRQIGAPVSGLMTESSASA